MDIVLLEFSSRKNHPLGAEPVIHIQDVRSPARPSMTTIRICGDNLFVAVKHVNDDQWDLNKFYIQLEVRPLEDC